MHPIERYEQFRVAATVPRLIAFGTTYHIELNEAQQTFHMLQSGIEKQLKTNEMHFDTLALGHFPRALTKYEKKELRKDAAYFETMFAVETNPIKQVNNRVELLQHNPTEFMWLVKYWPQVVFEDRLEEYGDAIWSDDSFTDYDILLCRYDDPMIFSILQAFQEAEHV